MSVTASAAPAPPAAVKQPAASTENAGAYSVPITVSAAPTQIATTGVRYTGLTVLSAFEKGSPPSRANAYVIRESDVSPASAQR